MGQANQQVAKLDVKRSPLAAMAERLSVDAAELQNIVMATVMPSKDANRQPMVVTNEQFVSFLAVANAYGLDPLKKEIYAFPAKGGGIQPIVSIDGWLSIVNSHPEYDGAELVENHDDSGQLVSVTCSIQRKDRTHPTVITEYLAECKQGTDPWKQRPRRMLRHKALIQCARYAFGLGGIMEEDEAREIDITPAAGPARAAPSEARQELPAYPEADFVANLPKWRIAIEGGRLSADEVIDRVSTKGVLSDEQKQQIRDLEPIEAGAATEEGGA